MKPTQKPTNPFVYVIAAVIIAVLAIGVRYVIVAFDHNEEAITEESDIKNYLQGTSGKKKMEAPTTSSTGMMSTGTTSTGGMMTGVK